MGPLLCSLFFSFLQLNYSCVSSEPGRSLGTAVWHTSGDACRRCHFTGHTAVFNSRMQYYLWGLWGPDMATDVPREALGHATHVIDAGGWWGQVRPSMPSSPRWPQGLHVRMRFPFFPSGCELHKDKDKLLAISHHPSHLGGTQQKL
jgi:hypothetical protein